MSRNDFAGAEHQRRWLRPDWQRWMRHDAHLFEPPGANASKSYAARLVERLKAEEDETAREIEHKAFERELLELRCQLVDLKFELALRRLRLKAVHHSHFQPRVPSGRPGAGEWTRDGTGGSTRVAQRGPGNFPTRRFYAFPGMTEPQLHRLNATMQRYQDALTQIRERGDANWQPTGHHASARPEGVPALLSRMEARAGEAEARLEQLRAITGGNQLPRPEVPLLSFGRGLPLRSTFDGPGWIDVYRSAYNTPLLFEQSTWPSQKGTVAVTEIDGLPFFGVNKEAPGYTDADLQRAHEWRWTLINKYPGIMKTGNIGQIPNSALYHGETTLLLRASGGKAGALQGRTIDVQLDRDVCAAACEVVLPKLGLELGNPTVRFYNYKNGNTWIMQDGGWPVRKQK